MNFEPPLFFASGAKPKAWEVGVDDRMGLIADTLEENGDLKVAFPGLNTLLRDYVRSDYDVDRVQFHQRLLNTFRESKVDNTYQEQLAKLSPDERVRIEKFTDGVPIENVSVGFKMGLSLGFREHLQEMLKAEAVHISAAGPVHVRGLSSDDLKKRDPFFHKFVHELAQSFRFLNPNQEQEAVVGDALVYKNATFQNWGKLLEFVPTYTCIPNTVGGIQRIVKFAKAHDMGVRCAGFRHSWAPIFGRNGQIIISLLGLTEITEIPNTLALPIPLSGATELETIDIVAGIPRVPGNGLVRIGCCVTNERLRRWCIENKRYTLPLNVIMVELTIGGGNAPICHGAGLRHSTLSDLVRKVEYVDCHGNFQVIDNPEHLKAASGCFGVMGVITHLTMELSPMTFALFNPKKIPVVRAIPPPSDMKEEEIPPALRIPGLTPEQKEKDLEEFIKHCNHDYYAEWFWFPFCEDAWVNCWNDTNDPSGDIVDYPDPEEIYFQFISQFTMNVLQESPALTDLIKAADLAEVTATLISQVAMLTLPDKPVKTYLTDALHFRRGIQNVRVLDVELEIPLPAKANNPSVVDYRVVQRAWWDAILTCYKHSGNVCPQLFPLEMRVTGGSEVILAPQRGNELGTCSIEVLTLEPAKGIWVPYAQEIVDKWMSYTDSQGRRLKTRPHWAKQWSEFTIDGGPWLHRLKDVDYKDEIAEFKRLLAEIGEGHGWTLADLKRTFSNDMLDILFFGDIVL